MNFEKTSDNRYPIGEEIIGWSEKWIDEDFNPDGTRFCFCDNDESNPTWTMAVWCGSMDNWMTIRSGEDNEEYAPYNDIDNSAPTHWIAKPMSPSYSKK